MRTAERRSGAFYAAREAFVFVASMVANEGVNRALVSKGVNYFYANGAFAMGGAKEALTFIRPYSLMADILAAVAAMILAGILTDLLPDARDDEDRFSAADAVGILTFFQVIWALPQLVWVLW